MTFWKTVDEFPGSISLPYGIKTSHTWHEVGQILRIINDLEINAFVELGAHVGGLASAILPIRNYRDFVYVGLEIDPSIVHPSVQSQIITADVMTSMHMVRSMTSGRKTFFYCDGGNKIKEMWAYYQFLAPGDIIACHDYFDYQSVFGMTGFGTDEMFECKPEVWHKDLDFLFDDARFEPLPDYLLEGTRIMGFTRK